jgi:hypothetical protein
VCLQLRCLSSATPPSEAKRYRQEKLEYEQQMRAARKGFIDLVKQRKEAQLSKQR